MWTFIKNERRTKRRDAKLSEIYQASSKGGTSETNSDDVSVALAWQVRAENRASESARGSRRTGCFQATPQWRKSLWLTGSHGITGSADIYTSARRPPTPLDPTNRGITRNKEIANLLPVRYCPAWAGVTQAKSYFGFYGSPGSVPDRKKIGGRGSKINLATSAGHAFIINRTDIVGVIFPFGKRNCDDLSGRQKNLVWWFRHGRMQFKINRTNKMITHWKS